MKWVKENHKDIYCNIYFNCSNDLQHLNYLNVIEDMMGVAFFFFTVDLFIVGRQVVGGSFGLFGTKKQTNIWLIYLHIKT